MDINNGAQLQSQIISYIQAIADIFYVVLEKTIPLDKELKQYFRKHPQCGSKDRRFISEGVFSLFRWYGWLRNLAPKRSLAKAHESNKFVSALAAAMWLDGHDGSPFFKKLLEFAGIDAQFIKSASCDINEKKKKLGHFFKLRKLDILQLVPEWFLKVLPVDADIETLINSFQKRPPVWIRIQNGQHENVKKQLRDKEVVFVEHPKCLNAVKITSEKFKASKLAIFHSGGFEIQDLASQCIGLVCEAKVGECWWDVCAGAGGKSLLLADQMQNKGNVVVTDIRDKILQKLQARAQRAKFDIISVRSLADVCVDDKLFDGVLVDAPCSCTGIWRRNPDLRWTTQKDIFKTSVPTQLDICEMASKKVKKGGVLVYATCSLAVQENENLVDGFLKRNNNFELKRFKNPLDGSSTQGLLRISFEPFDNDGMFVAKLKRIK